MNSRFVLFAVRRLAAWIVAALFYLLLNSASSALACSSNSSLRFCSVSHASPLPLQTTRVSSLLRIFTASLFFNLNLLLLSLPRSVTISSFVLNINIALFFSVHFRPFLTFRDTLESRRAKVFLQLRKYIGGRKTSRRGEARASDLCGRLCLSHLKQKVLSWCLIAN